MTAPERAAAAASSGLISSHIPILTYHSLDDSRTPVSMAPTHFARQMQALHRSGWRSLGTGELLDGLARGAWPTRTFALTFDDGYANFCEQALPVLLPLGFTAIVFVVGAWVGRGNDWTGQPASVPRMPTMDWEALRLIASKGMTLGAHTLSHAHLPALTAGEAEREIADSRRLIEEHTGHEAPVFAYPYGDATPALEAMVGRYYRAGFGTRLAFCTRASRTMQLERIDMYYLQDTVQALAQNRPWLAPYLAVRRALRRVRSRLVRLGHDRSPGARAAVP
jgi:peptidoglycan/xylan/chitin deacetylase (PgdA/CDA1 family)